LTPSLGSGKLYVNGNVEVEARIRAQPGDLSVPGQARRCRASRFGRLTKGPPMRYEVRLPQLSMGMSDAEIVDWYVEDGETVPEGADLVEIEAEKARQVLTAPVAGVVRELQYDQGDVIEVRDLLCVIETAG
jgi:biotin carboxyl carrier protein